MELIAQVIALVLGLTLHEFAHAWMGHYLGDRTARDSGRLTLNPLAHIDPLATLALPLFILISNALSGSHFPVIAAAKPVPFNPWAVRGGRWGAALVGVAGPLTNFLIAIFFAICYNVLPHTPISSSFFLIIVEINVALGVFNLIPFPPLDGSRVMYAVAPEGLRDVMDRIERAGFVLLLFVMFFGFQFIAPLIISIDQAILQVLLPGLLP